MVFCVNLKKSILQPFFNFRSQGYTERFGIVKVDFDSEELTREPKMSYMLLKEIFANNGFPAPNATNHIF